MTDLDHTHDTRAHSWVASANVPGTDFPIQNLPLGAFQDDAASGARIGIAIGEQILDLAAALDQGLLPRLKALEPALRSDSLNALMAGGPTPRRLLRHAVFELLEATSTRQDAARTCLMPMTGVRMRLPAHIGDFTDFFTSIHHAQRTGELSRPEMPVAPNFRHMPIAYHGRASSVVESGVRCVRPRGQAAGPSGDNRYVPTDRLDFELNLGYHDALAGTRCDRHHVSTSARSAQSP